MDRERYELCVIGAGTAGFAAAQAARAQGRDVVLVAGSDELGGTCIRRGCMPAKAVLAAARVEGTVAKAGDLGIEVENVHVDMPALLRRKRALVDYFAEDRLHELERYPLIRGDARFVAPDTVAVDGRRIVADRFVVATGARVAIGSLEGLAELRPWTSTDVLQLDALPRSITIVGGGPIGCAFAQYFARLGSRVTLLQDAGELLRADDADVGAAVRAALERDGVRVVRDADFRRAREYGGEHVMVATNRRPAIDGLDLAAAGIDSDARRGIAVDATLRTSNARVYAAGDVIGRRQLVHAAEHAGALAARNAFSPQPQACDWDRWETHAVYTDPQVAVVGLSERTCRERGLDVAVASLPVTEVGKALVDDAPDGFVKMIVRRDDNTIVGVTIVAEGAVELAGEATALTTNGATARTAADMPHLHPTMSELLGRVAERLAACGPAGYTRG